MEITDFGLTRVTASDREADEAPEAILQWLIEAAGPSRRLAGTNRVYWDVPNYRLDEFRALARPLTCDTLRARNRE